MKIRFSNAAILVLAAAMCVFLAACRRPEVTTAQSEPAATEAPSPAESPVAEPSPAAEPAPTAASKLAVGPEGEILGPEHSETGSAVGKVDFRNFKYPLPRGWQDADGKDAVLEKGVRPFSEAEEKIGLKYITAKFFDVTGDGQDEAIVILRIDTGGSGIPQIVYIFSMMKDEPELIWYFRTGDRADGGLKNIYPDKGEVVVELYGQDRYLLGELETSRITGDEEDLCCPVHFTRTRYKWNGNVFRMQGKRLTYPVGAPDAAPVENLAEKKEKELEKEKRGKK